MDQRLRAPLGVLAASPSVRDYAEATSGGGARLPAWGSLLSRTLKFPRRSAGGGTAGMAPTGASVWVRGALLHRATRG